MASEDLIRVDDDGLACRRGGFHVDPWRPVPLALVTHAHADHARPGSDRYLAATPSVPLLRRRLGEEAVIEGIDFGTPRTFGDTTVSFHPAGHVHGSAQIRVDDGETVWVVSGDYKRESDPTCRPFEIVPCDTFITEATFALPLFRWSPTDDVADEVAGWWQRSRDEGRAAVLFCYALGKAQRLLAELGRRQLAGGTTVGGEDAPIYLHGAMLALVDAYRAAGIDLPPTLAVADTEKGTDFGGALVLAPPSARGSSWMRRFGACRTAFASGWMRLRGPRRWRGVDRGFVLSDHADWPGLLDTIEQTGARRVLTTHGYADTLARYLREARGLDAQPLATAYTGEPES